MPEKWLIDVVVQTFMVTLTLLSKRDCKIIKVM
jgi:hypothetical protein